MKNKVLCWLCLLLCLALGLGFSSGLLIFIRPMEEKSYDLSLMWEGEALPADWVYDQKGWTVFCQEGNRVRPLTADGFGGFSGLSQLGETFYFSRTMTEELDSPTLRLQADFNSVAVFLDGDLLYTDCPEQKGGIGELTLPMLEVSRNDPVLITLPKNYQGKTLTIAQSTDASGSDLQMEITTVWPCPVTLDCGYAYESLLISESFRVAIPATLCLGVGVLLMMLFLWQTFGGRGDVSLMCVALIAFLWMIGVLSTADFSYHYVGDLPVDVAGQSRLFSLTVLLGFLGSRLTGRRKTALWVLTGLQGVAALVAMIPSINQIVGFLWQEIPQILGLIGLLAALGCALWEWRRGNRFSRFFCPLSIAGLVGGFVAVCLSGELRQTVLQQLLLGAQGYFLWPLMGVMMAAALIASIVAAVEQEATYRAETRLLKDRVLLARNSLENLRRHNEEVMVLRHDMTKHFAVLRGLAGESAPQLTVYLDDLLGQNETIRPIIQSGNETLDIILNGKMAEAIDAGIRVEVLRVDAPKTLPLSDAELSSVIMNIVDNAVEAAGAPGVKDPYIQLSMYQKGGFFVFLCKNSKGPQPLRPSDGPIPVRGLGLKIIRQIAKRYGDLLKIQQEEDWFEISLALPLE